MATGNRIVAVIRGIDGNEPHIEISDQNFKVMKTKGGDICIVHKKTEEYYKLLEKEEP